MAIILDGYFAILDEEKYFLNKDILSVFTDAWVKFDPDALGNISYDLLNVFLLTLDEPLGWSNKFLEYPDRQEAFKK